MLCDYDVTLASHAGVFRGAPFSSLPTNACSTEDNIPFPCLGNASKYRHRVTPMPINRVPIFSDSVFNRYRYYRYRLKRNRHRSKFFIGPINRIHQILTYICQRLSKGWNRRSRYVTDKNYIGQCLCQQKQSVNDWVFNAQTGWVRPSVYRRIVSCLSEMCIVSKNISDKCLHRRVLMEDNTRQDEEFLYRASLSER